MSAYVSASSENVSNNASSTAVPDVQNAYERGRADMCYVCDVRMASSSDPVSASGFGSNSGKMGGLFLLL
jgi:hypothetical protein